MNKNRTQNKRISALERNAMLNKPELFHNCKTYNQQTVSNAAPVFYDLTTLATTGRHGAEIKVMGIKSKLTVTALKDADTDQAHVRVMIVRSRQGVLSSAVMPGWSDCPDWDKYVVVYDSLQYLHSNGTDATNFHGFTGTFFNTNKKLKRGSIVRYDGSTAATSRGYYLYVIASSDAISLDLDGYIDVVFIDN